MLQHIHLEMSSDCSLESIISYLRVVLSLSSFSAQSNRRVFLVLFFPLYLLKLCHGSQLHSSSQWQSAHGNICSISQHPCKPLWQFSCLEGSFSGFGTVNYPQHSNMHTGRRMSWFIFFLPLIDVWYVRAVMPHSETFWLVLGLGFTFFPLSYENPATIPHSKARLNGVFCVCSSLSFNFGRRTNWAVKYVMIWDDL